MKPFPEILPPKKLSPLIHYLINQGGREDSQASVASISLPDFSTTELLAAELSKFILHIQEFVEFSEQDKGALILPNKSPIFDIIGLVGDLGAGKTLFTSAFIHSLLPGADVSSPTYSIMEEYTYQETPIFHLDLYRMEDPDELEGIGFWDFSTSGSLSLIEWADLFPETLTESSLLLELALDSTQPDTQRIAYLYTLNTHLLTLLAENLTLKTQFINVCFR